MYVNPAATEVYGCSQDEIIGKTIVNWEETLNR